MLAGKVRAASGERFATRAAGTLPYRPCRRPGQTQHGAGVARGWRRRAGRRNAALLCTLVAMDRQEEASVTGLSLLRHSRRHGLVG